MTLLILAALLASGASLWVIQPILARRAALLVDTAPGGLLDAEARKRVALASLKEVEYDFLAGKLDEADYRAQLDRLSAEALHAIQAADAAQAAHSVHLAGRPAAAIGAGGGAGIGSAHGCGFVNPLGSRFCAGCGARLS
ncbi:MAG TPA: zinc ribbon domain-containing protein [Longimicrobiaceae bacterium]|nr:zinc ribbon domain-containing protein [Longimicrobiaceae bacterium]